MGLLTKAISYLRKDSNSRLETKSAPLDYLLTTFSNNNFYFQNYSSMKLATEGFVKNVIAYRCATMIANQASRLKYELWSVDKSGKKSNLIENHQLLTLLKNPFPNIYESDFKVSTCINFLIFGNSFIWMKYGSPEENQMPQIGKPPALLLPLLSPYMRIDESGMNPFLPAYYEYNDKGVNQKFDVGVMGDSNIIHLKEYNPGSYNFGLSKMIPAGTSIDQHNAAGKHNYKMISNGARPSGVLVGPPGEEPTVEQKKQLGEYLKSFHKGEENSGEPIVLGGGWTWHQLSQNNVDMDFFEGKKSSANEIAIAFSVPRELINSEAAKYDNISAAYEQLWEDAVIPYIVKKFACLNATLVPRYGKGLLLDHNIDHVGAMIAKRARQMESLEKVTFITKNEKREAIGYEEHEEGDGLEQSNNTTSQGESEMIAKEISEGKSYDEARALAHVTFS